MLLWGRVNVVLLCAAHLIFRLQCTKVDKLKDKRCANRKKEKLHKQALKTRQPRNETNEQSTPH